MIFPESDLFSWVTYIVLITLGVSLAIASIRIFRGPSLPDRVIALDLVAYITIGFIATYAIHTDKPALLDAATVLALIAFLATAAFARYVQNTSSKPEGDNK
jgi:multicomponent Na+:H+ antiporter subunit F